jgi:hypothetical protein
MSQLRAGRTRTAKKCGYPKGDRLLGYVPMAAFGAARLTVRG